MSLLGFGHRIDRLDNCYGAIETDDAEDDVLDFKQELEQADNEIFKFSKSGGLNSPSKLSRQGSLRQDSRNGSPQKRHNSPNKRIRG